MGMGIMDAKYIESANVERDIGDQEHQIALVINRHGYIQRSTNNGFSRLTEKTVNWNIGDRVKLEFKNGKCSAYFNDEFLGNLTDDLPEIFYLAVSLYYLGSVLETTLFEIV